MPYAKSYKRPAYKKRYTKKAPSKATPHTTAQIANIARKVHRAERPVREIRFHVFKGFKTDTLANSFLSTDVSNIARGDLTYNRLSSKIVLNGIRYDLTFDSARAEDRYFRVFLVQPKNVNDPPDVATWADLYKDTTFNNRAPDRGPGDITFPLNTDVWNIYMDKTVKLAAAGTIGASKRMSGYLRLNKRIQFDETSNVPVDGGNIYLVVHAAEFYSTLGSTATVSNFDGMLRVFFKDA